MVNRNDDIFKLIPQRDPFLFVDKIIDFINFNGNSIKTEKRLTGQEDFFKGHFPGYPVMPGVLLCETMFQTGAILLGILKKDEKNIKKKIGVVTRIDKTKFKHLVHPKDHLIIEVKLIDSLENAYYFTGKISVHDKVVAQTNFTCTLIDKLD